MLSNIIAAAAVTAVPTQLWHVGDDGLSLKVSASIETTFKRDPVFTVGAQGDFIVSAPVTNVTFDREGSRPLVFFSYEISRAGMILADGDVRCSEQALADCAKVVVRAARKAVSK